MRNWLVLAALALLVAPGCGDDTTTASTVDMTAALDMSAASGDMAKIQTCAAIITCTMACGTNQTCVLGCEQNAVAAAQGRFLALSACVLETCGPGDGGNHSCSFPPDTTNTTCATCIQNTGVAAATNPSAPCHTEYVACSTN